MTEAQFKRFMGRYCMNVMRKRTVDEQLGDFAMILKTTVELKIVYKKTCLEVTYGIGPQKATVNGIDEYVGVYKREISRLLKEVICFSRRAYASANKRLYTN